jgi:YhcH/YjgK/YiaL family protein
MILDSLDNLEIYASLNPLFGKAIEYLKSTDLNALEVGKVKLQGDDLVVNISEVEPKEKEDAKLETHIKYIDIQIPLSGDEIMGYTAKNDLPDAEYDAEKDVTFYEGLADSYVNVKKGMFTIFFPQDGHAPAITKVGLKKIIVKILA